MITNLKTKNSLPTKCRIYRTKKIAIEYLEYADIHSLPIDFKNVPIPDGNRWIIYEYNEAKSVLNEKNPNILDPLNIKAKKATARTILIKGSDTYLTVYRQSEKKERDYYTLAHELGHIVLSHLTDFDETCLSRGGLDKHKYKILEREAELFAAELIMPFPILTDMNLNTYDEISAICKTSKRASKIRFENLYKYPLPESLNDTFQIVKSNFKAFINKRYCCICGCSTNKNNKFCPVCGSIKKNWGDGKMEYIKIPLDENGKAKKCPTCGNEDLDQSNKFCQVCGTFLYNYCTRCHSKLSGNARYCSTCGSESTFYKSEVLLSWEEDRDAYTEAQSYANNNLVDDGDIPF